MAKAIIWCRVSTAKQEFESQKKDLIKTATKDGFSIQDLIVIGAAGASARKMNDLYQKEVNELVQTIETTPDVKTIYVWEVSRLARNEVAFYQMKNLIIQKHIQFICKVPQLKLLQKNGKVNKGSEITLNLLVTLAKQEMEIKDERMARGKQRLAEEGRFNGGAIPYGYRIDKERGKLIVVDETESKVVREIYDYYEQGLSQLEIAKELRRKGYKGRASRKTALFTLSLVHQILTNKLLTGYTPKKARKGSKYIRTYPQIITPEQYQRCRDIAKKNNTKLPKSKRPYYAKGLIVCTKCGRKFTSTGEKGYYHCQDAYNLAKAYDGYWGEARCSNRLSISYNVIDALLWEMAKRYESIYIVKKSQEDKQNLEKKAEDIKLQLEQVPYRIEEEEKLRKRTALTFSRGSIDEDAYIKRDNEHVKELNEINADRIRLEEELTHINRLIDEIDNRRENVLTKKYPNIANIERASRVHKELNGIENDETRIALIHKHVQSVTIEDTLFRCEFGIHPEGKDAKARRITIHPYIGKDDVFIFIPFDGKGGHILMEHSSKFRPQFYEPLKLQFFTRRYDKGKYERREAAKNEKMDTIESLKAQGYLSIPEMAEISRLAVATIRRALTEKQIPEYKKIGIMRYVSKADFEYYLQKYHPKPRKQNK